MSQNSLQKTKTSVVNTQQKTNLTEKVQLSEELHTGSATIQLDQLLYGFAQESADEFSIITPKYDISFQSWGKQPRVSDPWHL